MYLLSLLIKWRHPCWNQCFSKKKNYCCWKVLLIGVVGWCIWKTRLGNACFDFHFTFESSIDFINTRNNSWIFFALLWFAGVWEFAWSNPLPQTCSLGSGRWSRSGGRMTCALFNGGPDSCGTVSPSHCLPWGNNVDVWSSKMYQKSYYSKKLCKILMFPLTEKKGLLHISNNCLHLIW